MTPHPHLGQEPVVPDPAVEAGVGSMPASLPPAASPIDVDDPYPPLGAAATTGFEGDRPLFPGRLRFGRPARAKGLPGAPVTGRSASVSDVLLDGFRSDQGVARAASVRGDGHRYGSEPRQDSAGCWWVPGEERGWTILAVADGLGSQPLSEVGSATALSALYELPGAAWAATASGDARAVEEIIEHVNRSIRREARLKNADPRQLSSTLTIAVVAHDQAVAWVIRVGDSPCYLVRERAWTSVFRETASEEIATTGTDCLPADMPVIEAQNVALLHGDVLVVCSDGFSGTLRVDGRDAYLAEQWGARPPSLTELLWQVDAMVKSYDDDRSVAAWWEGFDD